MKYIILLIISLLFCSYTQGQGIFFTEKMADKEFNRFNYTKAIKLYLHVVQKKTDDTRIIRNIAESYRKLNDSKNAEIWYQNLVNQKSAQAADILYYAQTLAKEGKYEKAANWYSRYSDLAIPKSIEGKMFSLAYNDLHKFYKDSSYFILKKASFNSLKSDFSPVFYKNGVVFVSDRKNAGIIKLLYNWTQQAYLDLYFTDYLATKPFSSIINTRYHEGPATFNKAQDTIIFTRNNYFRFYLKTDRQGINHLELYQASWNKKKRKWEHVEPLSLNNNNYSVGHPALSPDGNTLYFTSDMPGGYGETDIYMSKKTYNLKTGKTDWSSPVNLGESINTAGKEMFPFIDNNGNLYYATNGIPGLGGLDIFLARKNKSGGFDKPINMGFPVNTRFDDFGFVCDSTTNQGFLSSDRNNSVGDDDIYQWIKIPRPLYVLTYDKNSLKPLSVAKIFVKSETTSDSLSTNQNGIKQIETDRNKAIFLSVSKLNYKDVYLTYNTDELIDVDTLKIPLEPIKSLPKITFKGQVFSADDKQPVIDATAVLYNKQNGLTIEIKSDSMGSFNFALNADTDYIISIKLNNISENKCTTIQIEKSTYGITSDCTYKESFPVFCVGDVIKIENIYYDLGKYTIRRDAAKELDKLYDIMQKYPKLKIELRSHTDSRGSDKSNMILSDKRAKAAAAYLVSKGISPERIIGKGYGETMLINKCANGVQCTEAEHQINRRTEFKILSVE